MRATVSSDPGVVRDADLAVLPGVGAMPDAMAELNRAGLSDVLRARAAADRPIVGVCLGLQLLMSDGTEFEDHAGLGIIPGRVVRFPSNDTAGGTLRVPHIGWSPLYHPPSNASAWSATPLASLPDGVLQYFVHSYYVEPEDSSVVAAVSRYGGVEFCSALAVGSVFACQFHPERSGSDGLSIYKALCDFGWSQLSGRR
jgi:glutamine amidotransferase